RRAGRRGPQSSPKKSNGTSPARPLGRVGPRRNNPNDSSRGAKMEKKPVQSEKSNPLLFRCPYCGEDNISTTPPDKIFVAWRLCSYCAEEVLIEDGLPKRTKRVPLGQSIGVREDVACLLPLRGLPELYLAGSPFAISI